MRVQITFRSGAQIEVDATEESRIERSNGVTTFSWKAPEGCERGLVWLPNPEQIEAMVVIADPSVASDGE